MSKNIFNIALYNARQYYLNEKKYINYVSNYHLYKENENYIKLNANMAQQILKVVDRSFKSFLALIDFVKKVDVAILKDSSDLDMPLRIRIA